MRLLSLSSAVSALSLLLLAPACSPAVGERQEGQPDADAHGHAAEDAVFGAADVRGFVVEEHWAQSSVLTSERLVTRGGVLIDLWSDVGDARVEVEVRGVRADGSVTGWRPAEITWQEAPHLVARADLGEAVAATQFRIPESQTGWIENVVYSAVTPAEDDQGDSTPPPAGQITEPLVSSLIGLVQPRTAWRARTTRCSTKSNDYSKMAVHHTFTPPSSSGGYEVRLRSIQAYHMDTRGWCDVGYHFLVTEDGRVWEGRALDYLGAHVSNNNTGNIGFSWVGCYQPGECEGISSAVVPPEVAIEGAGRAMRELVTRYRITDPDREIRPHRGHPGASTTCPGDELASRIPDLIRLASGEPALPPPAPSSDAGASPPGDPAPAPGRALGVVWDASRTSSPSASGNVRIPGAVVAVVDGPTTTARAGDAFFSLSLSPGTYTLSASAPGWLTVTKTVTITSGADTWSSVGLEPEPATAPPPAPFSTPEASWTCGGTAGTHPSASGSYFVTSFGCWVDENGVARSDSGDNCIPWCMTGAAGQGRAAQWDALCGGLAGPDCERHVNWFAADADRFGCAARVRVTNPANGRSAVVAILDRGPACWVEAKVSHWTLDLSNPASNYLFGGQMAVTERGEVMVEEVSTDTPLGPS